MTGWDDMRLNIVTGCGVCLFLLFLEIEAGA